MASNKPCKCVSLTNALATSGPMVVPQTKTKIVKLTSILFFALVLALIPFLFSNAADKVIYSCTGQDGIKQYVDQPRKLNSCNDKPVKILAQEDSTINTDTPQSQENRISNSPEINTPVNADGPRQDSRTFRSKWISDASSFTILHLGDSHVRADSMINATRDALIDAKPGGNLVYKNFGINGSTYASIDKILDFFENPQLARQPDLLILDWGTNEIAKSNKVPENHSKMVIKLINRARKAYPQAAIMLTSAQDMNYRGRNISAASEYSSLMRQIANQNNCFYFDWYQISGGSQSVNTWVRNGFMQPDNIHLTHSGYRRKGIMLAKSIEQALVQTAESP